MAINQAIRDELPEGAYVFDNSAYDNSIIGVTVSDEVVYDYDLMVEEYIKDNNCSREDAIDWIEYNTVRSLMYFNKPNKPIIMYNMTGLFDNIKKEDV